MSGEIVAAWVNTREAERRNVVHYRVVLSSKRHRAEAVVRQPRIRLIAELTAALAGRSVRHAKTVFKLKNRLRAATEIFVPDEAPVASGHVAAPRLPCGMTFRIAGIGKARIDHPVERHARLCLRPASVPRRAYGYSQSLLHLCPEVSSEPPVRAPTRRRCG